MTTTVLSIDAIPGPELRQVLRRGLTSDKPWTLVIDARTTPPPSLNKLALALRLTRRARRHRGQVIVVVDEASRARLKDAGVAQWLHLTTSTADPRAGEAMRPVLSTE